MFDYLIIGQKKWSYISRNLEQYLIEIGKNFRSVFSDFDKVSLIESFTEAVRNGSSIIVINNGTYIEILNLIEFELENINPEQITVWNTDAVPNVYRDLPWIGDPRIVHSSEIDALIWNRIFSKKAHFTNGLFDICNIRHSMAITKHDDIKPKFLFPANLAWGGHTLESLKNELIKKEVAGSPLLKYMENLVEIVGLPWQETLSNFDLNPNNIRYQRGSFLLYHLSRREMACSLYQSLQSVPENKDTNPFNKEGMLDGPNKLFGHSNNSLHNDQINYSNRLMEASDFVFSPSYTTYYHDRTVRAMLCGSISLVDEFSGYADLFGNDCLNVLSYKNCKAEVKEELFDLSASERSKLYKQQLELTRKRLSSSNFEVLTHQFC